MSFVQKIKSVSYEDIALYSFILGVSFTVLGPVIHYTASGVILLALLYGTIKYHAPLVPNLHGKTRIVAIVFLIFTLWSIFPNALVPQTLYQWGHGASYYLEFFIWIMFGIRILNSDEKQSKFIKYFTIINVTLAFCYALSELNFSCGSPLDWSMPNGSMKNNNNSGLYGIMILPLITYYAFYCIRKSYLRFIAVLAPLSMVAFSPSSGGWLASGIEGVIILYYLVKDKKLSMKQLGVYVIGFMLLTGAVDIATGSKLQYIVQDEMKQINYLKTLNMSYATSGRWDIWKATIYLSKKHPVLGNGAGTFKDRYNDNIEAIKKAVPDYSYTQYTMHPHSAYLMHLYVGGIPSLLLFCLVYLMLLYLAYDCVKHGPREKKYKYATVLTTLIGIAIFNIYGDILNARRDIALIFFTIVSLTMVMIYNRENKRIVEKTDCNK